MAYLVKQQVTAQNINGDTFNHNRGTVVSDWELSDYLREKIAEGSEWYRERFEPLLEHEAHSYRVKATNLEPPHVVDGQEVPAPWDDYVGLHPTEIMTRLRDCDVEESRRVKDYERGGMNRLSIIEFVTPSEREPFDDYDNKSVSEILEKMSVLSEPHVNDVIAYERAHKARPAILEYDRDIYEQPAGTAA